jgi:fructoselysine 6-phosphate deglycase
MIYIKGVSQMRSEHLSQITQAINELKNRSINTVYFVACGGSQAVLMPGKYIFDKETTIPSQVYNANEFVYDTPASLDSHSLVITCSHSGNTPETVAATKLARENGALTIALSNLEGSELWNAAEFPVHYDWGTDVSDSDKNKGIFYGVLFKVLELLAPDQKWATCFEALDLLTDLSTQTKKQYKDAATKWAIENKRKDTIYTIGSGLNYGEVYSTAMCWFMEMQWINSGCIHSGEYFHGPFEITDFDVPFLLVKGIGKTRFLDQRVENFATKYSQDVLILDQTNLPLASVPEEAKPYIAAILSGVAIRVFVEAIAYHRGHSLDVRRYMWHLEY